MLSSKMRSAIARLEARATGMVSPVRSTSTTSFSSDSKPVPGCETRFATTMSQFFARSLAARFLDQILGFGGEADQQPVALLRPDLGQNIGRGIEFERQPRGGLLHLLLRTDSADDNRPPPRP